MSHNETVRTEFTRQAETFRASKTLSVTKTTLPSSLTEAGRACSMKALSVPLLLSPTVPASLLETISSDCAGNRHGASSRPIKIVALAGIMGMN